MDSRIEEILHKKLGDEYQNVPLMSRIEVLLDRLDNGSGGSEIETVVLENDEGDTIFPQDKLYILENKLPFKMTIVQEETDDGISEKHEIEMIWYFTEKTTVTSTEDEEDNHVSYIYTSNVPFIYPGNKVIMTESMEILYYMDEPEKHYCYFEENDLGFREIEYLLSNPTFASFVDTNNIDVDGRISMHAYNSAYTDVVLLTLKINFVIGFSNDMSRIEPIITFALDRSSYFAYHRIFTGNYIPAVIERNNKTFPTVVRIENIETITGRVLRFYPIELLVSGDVLKINTVLTYSG